MREVQHGEADDRERQRGDQPVEDEQQRPDHRDDRFARRAAGPLFAAAVAISASVINVAVVPRAPSQSAPRRRRETPSSAPADRDAAGTMRPTADLSIAQIAGRSNVTLARSAPEKVANPLMSCRIRQSISASAGVFGLPSSGILSDSSVTSGHRSNAQALSVTCSARSPLRMPARSAGPPGTTRAAVTDCPGDGIADIRRANDRNRRRRSQAGRNSRRTARVPRLRATGVGAARPPAAPASPPTAARMAPTTSRSEGRLIQVRL